MDLKVIGYEDVNGIHLAHDKFQWWTLGNATINIRAGIFFSGGAIIGF
jgi:hypothetical protein